MIMIISVSYTHLDVYKRQRLYRGDGSISLAASEKMKGSDQYERNSQHPQEDGRTGQNEHSL